MRRNETKAGNSRLRPNRRSPPLSRHYAESFDQFRRQPSHAQKTLLFRFSEQPPAHGHANPMKPFQPNPAPVNGNLVETRPTLGTAQNSRPFHAAPSAIWPERPKQLSPGHPPWVSNAPALGVKCNALVGQRTGPHRSRCERNRLYSSTDASISRLSEWRRSRR